MANRTRLFFFSESVESSLGKLSLSVWHYQAHNSEDTVTVLYCTVSLSLTLALTNLTRDSRYDITPVLEAIIWS